MSISFWTICALALVLYFGWALADPTSVQEVEDHLARESSASRYGILSFRVRNALGLVVGLLLLGFSFNRDISRVPGTTRQTPAAARHSLPPPAVEHNQSLLDRIDGATLQKQIEHQEEMSRASESPAVGGS